MVSKCRLFGDIESETLPWQTNNPKEQKKIGETVKNYDREKWIQKVDNVQCVSYSSGLLVHTHIAQHRSSLACELL